MAGARGQVQEYEGLFKGVGTTSKEPVFGKKSNAVGELHKATHFAVGCQKWDDHAVRGKPRSHVEHAHPEVSYGTCDAPQNNLSQIHFEHQEHSGATHYRTEQRVRYDHPGPPQPREQPFGHQGSVCLGSDQHPLQSQKKAVHARIEDGELQRSAAMRAAGQGALVPSSQWPKPPRCHVLHGGPRHVDGYDLGVMNGGRHGRITANYSNVMYEANARDPILGHYVPLAAHATAGMRTTSDIITEANEEVPPLRSLMAVRPHV